MAEYNSGDMFAERYRLVEKLHVSNFSSVWTATDSLSRDTQVVLKIFSPALRKQAEFGMAFKDYTSRLISFLHPNLLLPRQFDAAGPNPYLVLPSCPAGSLADMKNGPRRKGWTEDELLLLIEDIGAALAYLHEQQPPVLHRQLTKEDILLDEEGHYRLADFGRSDAMLNSGGSQRAAIKSDRVEDDIFSFGSILYNLAVGKPPFQAGVETLGLKAGSTLPRPNNISQETWNMICRCLSSEREMRPTAAEMAREARWKLSSETPKLDADVIAKPSFDLSAISSNAKYIMFGLLALLVIITTVVLWPRNRTATPASSATVTILKLHGSNTIGAELMPELVVDYLKSKGAIKLVREPRAPEEMVIRCTMPGKAELQQVEIYAKGSATAFEDLLAKNCDIGMASRRVNDKEKISLAGLGEMTSPACEHVLGLDGIAIIVNPANPITQLQKAQVADIFNGKITNWKDIGGADQKINLNARDDKSGTYDTFKSLILGKEGKLAAGTQRFESSDQLRQTVADDPGGIGFVGLATLKSVKVLAVADGANFIIPNAFTVATEDYPLSRRLFLYTPANSTNPMVRDFVEFVLSAKGQDVATKIGFIGQNLKAEAKSTAPQRLNVNFRFTSGSVSLDNKATADLDRLVALLMDPAHKGKKISLHGYADNYGPEESNLEISRQRAESVAAALRSRGITITVVDGLGSASPIADNATADGRDRNRRVEVWME